MTTSTERSTAEAALVVATGDGLRLPHQTEPVLPGRRVGAIAADGTPAEVLRPDPLRAVYEVEVEVRSDPVSGRPFVIPLTPRGPA